MEDQKYLDDYEVRLCVELLRLVHERVVAVEPRLAPDEVLDVPDLMGLWKDIAMPYCVEAIRDLQDYPTAALGWMMYTGMALAHKWDEDWHGFQLGHPHPFEYLRDLRGWDEMDEAIREDILGLSVPPPKQGEVEGVSAYAQCEDLVRSCAQLAYARMRKEDVEPQTPMAYHVFLRTIRALYRTGITLELRRLGYTAVHEK